MKYLSKVCTLLLALVLVLSVSINAFAAGSVTYDVNANKFIFSPGTKQSPTSLFTNFQNVMPGDTLTEQIQIRNNPFHFVNIKVYMRSLGAQEGTDDFLSQMNLTVKQTGKSTLFDAPADERAQLTDWVYLGTVKPGGKITLDLSLEVPITMGNEFQNNIGYIDWQFKVEEHPIDLTSPKTGDFSNIAVYFGILLVSFVSILALICAKWRRKSKKTSQ